MKNKKKLKIIIMALPDSIHVVRWTNQIKDEGWEIHFFPSVNCNELHLEQGFHNIFIHLFIYGRRLKGMSPTQRLNGLLVFSNFLSDLLRYLIQKIFPEYRIWYLNYLIKKIQPDIIHSMEFQHAGYLVAEAKKKYKGQFPKWIATNWGSDIYLFGRLKEHQSKIKEVLSGCDYYSCECQRDVRLAKDYGLKAKVLPVFPNSGGFDLRQAKILRAKKPSQRKIILLKGYQGIFGRSHVGLRSLERCQELLKGYKIYIFSYAKNNDIVIAARVFTARTGIPIKLIPKTSHQNILKLQSLARIYIGLCVSDAISTSLLEAMVMGSFPIQSNTSCGNEWIKDGKSGFLVSPEDPDIIEPAIRKALEDDELVDRAAQINWHTATKKLDEKIIKKQIIDFYNEASAS